MNEFKQFERAEFTTDFLGDGARYRLPRRGFAKLRHLGWIVMGVGLFITLFMLAWMSGPILDGIKDFNKGRVDIFSIAFGCFGLFGLIPGLGMLLGGFAIITNRTRCDVQIRNGKIIVKERFFLAWLKRKRPIANIRTLSIIAASDSLGKKKQHDMQVWAGDYDTGLVAKGDAKDFPIAIGYPREMLTRLAEEIAPRLEAEISLDRPAFERDSVDFEKESPSTRSRIAIVEDIDKQDVPVVPDQPADSAATIDRRPHGITIEIPPVGVWKGSKGLMFFAVLWNLFVSLFLVVSVLATFGVIEMEDGSSPPWVMLLMMIPFVAVGVGLTLGAINMGRRRATIATADDLVMVVRHTIFGKTTKEWSSNDIDTICCGNSGMEVNEVPVKELQIIPLGSKKFGCLSQLDEDELVWIAAELKLALGLGAPGARGKLDRVAVPRDEIGFAAPAGESRITIERTIDGLKINVPPRGLLRYIGMFLFSLVFLAIGIGVAVGIGWSELKDGFRKEELSELLIGSVFLLSFGGFGIGMISAVLVAARRQFRLTVAHDELTLLRRGPFFRKTFRWHRDDLEPLDVIDSGTQVNGRSLQQVFVQSRKGTSVGIMTGHDRADLAVVATAVNESLELTENDPAPT